MSTKTEGHGRNTKANKAEDQIIGRNVRRIRHARGMSQEKLGEALGLTFQQVQKYEKGTNRIGGSRMVQITNALGCTILELFEGTAIRGVSAKSEPDPCLELGVTPLGVRWARAFGRLPPPTRHAMVKLAEGVLES